MDSDSTIVTTLSSAPRLEILPSPPGSTSSDSTTSSSVAGHYAWRSLVPLPSDPDELGIELPPLLYGVQQGLSLSPAAYMEEREVASVLEQAEDLDQDSIPDSMPSLSPGSILHLDEDSSSLSTDVSEEVQREDSGIEYPPGDDQEAIFESGDEYTYTSMDNSYHSYGEEAQEMQTAADMQWEGETVASTTSFVSRVEVYMNEEDSEHLVGYRSEIPIRELDDPPDEVGWEAASLSSDNEIEQVGNLG